MAISTKVITMRQGNKSDYQPSKMLSGELAVINDAEELHFSPKTGKSIRVATENDLKKVGNTIDDALSETSTNPVQNKVVTAKFRELSGQISQYGIYVGDTQPTNGVMYWLDTSGDSSGEAEPDIPDTPVVTLSSISATYNGGSVLVGTSVNALTGIVVTAKYSDGTTKTVTGYTLSGTIKEGSNTVTISYGGKSTTITVIGYAENEPDVPEVTLSSISATYTGGDVPVGTNVSSLTGITVTGHYSDGSTSTITGYTLSGSIAEGSNTITVSYDGKTTTFVVVGVAESGGDDVIVNEITPSYLEMNVSGAKITDTSSMNTDMPDTMCIVAKNAQDYWSVGTEVRLVTRTSTYTKTVVVVKGTAESLTVDNVKYAVFTFTKNDFNAGYLEHKANIDGGLIEYTDQNCILLGNKANRFDSTRTTKAFDGKVNEATLRALDW